MKVLRAALVAYAGGAALALVLIPASAMGWLGSRMEALATFYSLALALPWTPVLLMVPGDSPWVGAALLASAAGVNLVIGLLVLRELQER